MRISGNYRELSSAHILRTSLESSKHAHTHACSERSIFKTFSTFAIAFARHRVSPKKFRVLMQFTSLPIFRSSARTSARCSTFLIDAFDILPVFRVSRLTNVCVTRVLSTCLSYLSDFEVSVVPACEFQGNKTMPQEMNVLCCYACKMYQVS